MSVPLQYQGIRNVAEKQYERTFHNTLPKPSVINYIPPVPGPAAAFIRPTNQYVAPLSDIPPPPPSKSRKKKRKKKGKSPGLAELDDDELPDLAESTGLAESPDSPGLAELDDDAPYEVLDASTLEEHGITQKEYTVYFQVVPPNYYPYIELIRPALQYSQILLDFYFDLCEGTDSDFTKKIIIFTKVVELFQDYIKCLTTTSEENPTYLELTNIRFILFYHIYCFYTEYRGGIGRIMFDEIEKSIPASTEDRLQFMTFTEELNNVIDSFSQYLYVIYSIDNTQLKTIITRFNIEKVKKYLDNIRLKMKEPDVNVTHLFRGGTRTAVKAIALGALAALGSSTYQPYQQNAIIENFIKKPMDRELGTPLFSSNVTMNPINAKEVKSLSNYVGNTLPKLNSSSGYGIFSRENTETFKSANAYKKLTIYKKAYSHINEACIEFDNLLNIAVTKGIITQHKPTLEIISDADIAYQNYLVNKQSQEEELSNIKKKYILEVEMKSIELQRAKLDKIEEIKDKLRELKHAELIAIPISMTFKQHSLNIDYKYAELQFQEVDREFQILSDDPKYKMLPLNIPEELNLINTNIKLSDFIKYEMYIPFLKTNGVVSIPEQYGNELETQLKILSTLVERNLETSNNFEDATNRSLLDFIDKYERRLKGRISEVNTNLMIVLRGMNVPTQHSLMNKPISVIQARMTVISLIAAWVGKNIEIVGDTLYTNENLTKMIRRGRHQSYNYAYRKGMLKPDVREVKTSSFWGITTSVSKDLKTKNKFIVEPHNVVTATSNLATTFYHPNDLDVLKEKSKSGELNVGGTGGYCTLAAQFTTEDSVKTSWLDRYRRGVHVMDTLTRDISEGLKTTRKEAITTLQRHSIYSSDQAFSDSHITELNILSKLLETGGSINIYHALDEVKTDIELYYNTQSITKTDFLQPLLLVEELQDLKNGLVALEEYRQAYENKDIGITEFYLKSILDEGHFKSVKHSTNTPKAEATKEELYSSMSATLMKMHEKETAYASQIYLSQLKSQQLKLEQEMWEFKTRQLKTIIASRKEYEKAAVNHDTQVSVWSHFYQAKIEYNTVTLHTSAIADASWKTLNKFIDNGLHIKYNQLLNYTGLGADKTDAFTRYFKFDEQSAKDNSDYFNSWIRVLTLIGLQYVPSMLLSRYDSDKMVDVMKECKKKEEQLSTFETTVKKSQDNADSLVAYPIGFFTRIITQPICYLINFTIGPCFKYVNLAKLVLCAGVGFKMLQNGSVEYRWDDSEPIKYVVGTFATRIAMPVVVYLLDQVGKMLPKKSGVIQQPLTARITGPNLGGALDVFYKKIGYEPAARGGYAKSKRIKYRKTRNRKIKISKRKK